MKPDEEYVLAAAHENSLLADSSTNGIEHFLIAWKSNPALLCNELAVDPDREFAGLSADCFDLNT